MLFHLTPISRNQKTGPIPVSTSCKSTCPKSCALKNQCYAKFGPLNCHWSKISNGERGIDYKTFLRQIKNLPNNQLWRHNQAGDLIGEPTNNEKICEKSLNLLIKANRGKRGFLYTHKWKNFKNIRLIQKANANGLTINFSANSLTEADFLVEYGPTVVVLTENKNTTTPKGRKVIVCPAVNKDTNCSICKICSKADRNFIVGFPAHGIAKNQLIGELKNATRI